MTDPKRDIFKVIIDIASIGKHNYGPYSMEALCLEEIIRISEAIMKTQQEEKAQ